MIQPAATSANSSLLLSAAMPAAMAEAGAATVDFAAILGLEGKADIAPAAPDAAAALQLLNTSRPATGKPSGKTLPDALPDTRELAGDNASESSEEPVQPIINDPLLAILNAVAVAPTLVQTPKPDGKAPEGRGSESKAPTTISVAPATTIPVTPATTIPVAPATTLPAVALANEQKTASQPAMMAAKAVAAQPVAAPVAEQPVATQPKAPDAVIAVPIADVRALTPRQPEVTIPAAIALNTAAALPVNGAKPMAATDKRLPDAAPIAAAMPEEPMLAPALLTPAVPSAASPVATSAASQDIAAPNEESAKPSPTTATATASKADTALQPQFAADVQPAMALHDSQPIVTNQPAFATPAQPSPASGHDFAKLVDRLVEAREALVPQPVQTSILTSEFGRVSLRFEQDDAGLRVAMNSADPDFARAVQAAQPVAAAQTTDNNAGGQRHDAQGQQNAGSGFATSQNNGQPGAQSQTQTSARNQQDGQGGSPRMTGRSSQNANDHDEAGQRGGGIYA